MLKLLEKPGLPSFLASLQSYGELCAPVCKNGGHAFAVVGSPSEIVYDYQTTVLSPKKFLLPPRDTMFRFSVGPEVALAPTVDASARVIFGIHPCDINAMWMLDAALTENPSDALYLSRRDRTLIVGLDCNQPCDEYCFCRSMGTHVAETGFDLLLTDVGDAHVVQIGTPRGQAMLNRWGEAKEVRYEHRAELRNLQRQKEEWPRPLDMDVETLPRLLEDSYTSLLWDVLGDKCLACGSCTMVCPTCYCFDVIDEVDLSLRQGERRRQWDSCQLRDFALVAGGENFRARRSARNRHRFFRKGKWLKEKYNKFACVGCGRCARACLAKINPVEVYNQLRGGV